MSKCQFVVTLILHFPIEMRTRKQYTVSNDIIFCSSFRFESLELDDENIQNVLQYANDSISGLKVLIDGDPSFAWALPTLPNDYAQPEWLCKLIDTLQDVEFQRPIIATRMREFAKSEGINFMKMMKTIRVLLSGKKDGYQIPEMMHILGKDRTIRRLLRTNDTHLKELSTKN